jgi:hypothetical protein
LLQTQWSRCFADHRKDECIFPLVDQKCHFAIFVVKFTVTKRPSFLSSACRHLVLSLAHNYHEVTKTMDAAVPNGLDPYCQRQVHADVLPCAFWNFGGSESFRLPMGLIIKCSRFYLRFFVVSPVFVGPSLGGCRHHFWLWS